MRVPNETIGRRGALGLRAGDRVEVRSAQEILATLDDKGALDGLPFMPEMLHYCGQQLSVFRRADKTCDTVGDYKSLRMLDAVHLDNLRCDGSAHGGCQAGCLLFWKEAWLKRAEAAPAAAGGDGTTAASAPQHTLQALTRRQNTDPAAEPVYVCQATELPRATTPIKWWDPRQYWRELHSGNIALGTFVVAMVNSWYAALRRKLGEKDYPNVPGPLRGKTPRLRLDLEPGERVRVRSHEAIMQTLNRGRRNRGLWFDIEMTPYCGREYTVLRRVTQIINEKTGRMQQLPGDCLILDGVVCQGCLSRKRLFCPRSIYPYWREIWLERVAGDARGAAR